MNTVMLALSWYGQSQKWVTAIENINYVFLAIFTVEAILKLYAFDIRFFRDGWNIFDLMIVIGAFIGLIINSYTDISSVGSATTVIRSFRICRIFRLMRKYKGLTVIFQTFMITLPALINVGALLVLFVYIYAILGVNLFADIKHTFHISDHVNFQDVGTAMLTLLRISTGENWHYVLSSLQNKHSILYDCVTDPTYDDYKANSYKPVGCGKLGSTTIYFSSFVLIVSLVFLNLFIAIILLGFSDSSDDEQFVFSADTTDRFTDIWAKFDPDATSYIPCEDLEDFLTMLGAPLGFGVEQKENPFKAETFVSTLEEELEKYEDDTKYYFVDVLEILSLNHMLNVETSKTNEGGVKDGTSSLKQEKDELKKSILIGQSSASLISKEVLFLEEKAKKKRLSKGSGSSFKIKKKDSQSKKEGFHGGKATSMIDNSPKEVDGISKLGANRSSQSNMSL
jgi:hypothetical protein